MTKKHMILALFFLAACNSGEVDPGATPEMDTDSGLGEDSGTGEPGEPHQCFHDNAPNNAVRWQCGGLAKATIAGTLDIDVDGLPDIIDADLIEYWADGGKIYWFELFGLWADEDYDDPGVNACCLEDLDDGEEEEGVDETGGDDTLDVPQVAEACSFDCADQACRQIPKELRRLADELPPVLPLGSKSYRKQVRDLANWTAEHHNDCYYAMTDGGTENVLGGYEVRGTWNIPNSASWPALVDLSVDGECTVFNWVLPEDGEPDACMGINDNNDEDTFDPEGAGAGFGGFDTFAPTGGEMRLDGPTIFGVPATGSAPVLGLNDDCDRGLCTRVDAFVDDDGVLELRRAAFGMPASMTWEANGMALNIDDLRAVVERPVSAQLFNGDRGVEFSLPTGQLEVLFSGQVHQVPVKVAVTNSEPVTGTVVELDDGTQVLAFDPIALTHHDAYGTWLMTVELDEMVSVQHSPRTRISADPSGNGVAFDGRSSMDPDGDALTFEWFVDGEAMSEASTLQVKRRSAPQMVTLRVSDATGRSTWGSQAVAAK